MTTSPEYGFGCWDTGKKSMSTRRREAREGELVFS
jgi:hypothetical protein